MITVTFALKDKKDLKIFLKVAEKFGATQITEKQHALPKSKFKSRDEFYELFGVGKSSPTTVQEIRGKAWQRNK
jgi:hypothetical protein